MKKKLNTFVLVESYIEKLCIRVGAVGAGGGKYFSHVLVVCVLFSALKNAMCILHRKYSTFTGKVPKKRGFGWVKLVTFVSYITLVILCHPSIHPSMSAQHVGAILGALGLHQ